MRRCLIIADGAVEADGEESSDEIEFLPDVLAGYNAAVKILVTEQSPDWINPWQVHSLFCHIAEVSR